MVGGPPSAGAIVTSSNCTKHIATSLWQLKSHKMAGKFEPKEPVKLNPPKDDPITLEELSKCNGTLWNAPRRQASNLHVRMAKLDGF